METRKHVLVIDDEAATRMLLRKLLETAGYRVSEAKNALEVFSLDPATPPDLIILDIQMPGISGHKVLSTLKSDGSFKAPILVCSGLTDPVNARKIADEGADAFMAKPIRKEPLLALVADLLSRSTPQS